MGGSEPSPVAAVDCGTNSTRLLVLSGDGHRLERHSRITRLGAGVDRSGRLDASAIERTLSVLADYARLVDGHGVPPAHVRVAATSAARDAANAEEFLAPAEKILGVRPEVIVGEEEGRLSYRGATADLDHHDGPFLVVDIGGGSTELIVGRPGDVGDSPAAVISLDIGCVRLTERHLPSDPPTGRELAAAHAAARAQLRAARDENPAYSSARRLIGLAGTVSAVTVLALGLGSFVEEKVHLARISRDEVVEVTRRLATLPLEERKRVAGLEPERADVIVGGAVILDEVLGAFGFSEFTTSESDILDGIALGILESLPG